MKYTKDMILQHTNDIIDDLTLDSNTPMDKALLDSMAVYVRDYEEARKNGANEDDLESYVKSIKSELAYYDDLMRLDRLEELHKLDRDAAIAEYLANQTVKTYGFIKTETGYVLTEENKGKDITCGIDAGDFIDAVLPVEADGIRAMAAIIGNNIARVSLHDAGVSISRNYKDNIAKEMGWVLEDNVIAFAGNTFLARQLTEFIQRAFNIDKDKEGKTLKMITADVKFLSHGLIQSVSGKNQSGKFVLRNENTILEYIFRALFTRYNQGHYDFQNATTTKKASK